MDLLPDVRQWLLAELPARRITNVRNLQTLWSGYGAILRVGLEGGPANSVIVKQVTPPTEKDHPRGWNTTRSHERKLRSYEVESCWYRSWSDRCDPRCRVATCLAQGDIEGGQILVLEDLDAAGFPIRRQRLGRDGVAAGLRWLAHFHAKFMGEDGDGLWPNGTYWHLETRPDEWQSMPNGPLKDAAVAIDQRLQSVEFQTLVHGDAKVANFCFANDFDSPPAVVDFQYVGRGCGMKDVAYFLGSCLDETECERSQEADLKIYFDTLSQALGGSGLDVASLECQWRAIYPIAWADFVRFLEGWCPGHAKLHRYSRKMVDIAIELCDHA
ncbi:ecdysteroid 22-kinase family protein [Aporhodopirellula aestuarii]|uniref:Ecdysteroid 22-kinase family protein n=1 Tax=Aporhodopirellula aestuarii TaxID=2950107 RepID=A0ABT0UC92_9BACT|nr:ecdysteroid 22-kinase family protein [Aporhodopirellula aestuarii]MCM2374508.1 ecdysteroid 22-kinase family protein [Aporhodopirellula aestuarii]